MAMEQDVLPFEIKNAYQLLMTDILTCIYMLMYLSVKSHMLRSPYSVRELCDL